MDDMAKKITLVELLRLLRRHWGIGCVSFLSVVFTVGFLTFYAEKEYEASAILSLREGVDIQDQLFDLPSIIRQKYLVKNQVAILESRRLTKDVIKKLQESIHKDSLGILGCAPPRDVQILKEKLLFWRSKPDTQLLELSLKKIVEEFQSSTKVSFGKESDIIEVIGRAATPWETAFMVNTWVEVFQDYNRSGNLGEVSQTRILLENKRIEYQKKLAISESLLTKYQKKENVISLSDETKQLVGQATNFESLYNKDRTELEAVEKEIIYLYDQLDENKKNFVEKMTTNSSLRVLLKQLTEEEAKKVMLEAQLRGAGLYSTSNEQLIQKENRIKGIREKINKETKKLLDQDMGNINPLDYSENLTKKILELEITRKSLIAKTDKQKEIIKEYNQKLETIPDKSQKLARLKRDVELNSKIFTMVSQQLEEIRIREAGQMGNIHIVDLAEAPTKAVYPKTFLNMILGCFFGLFLGFGFAFAREYFETSVRNEEDLERMGLHVIGEVPLHKNGKLRASHRYRQKNVNIIRARAIFPHLLTQQNGQSTFSESYRAIRTSILLSNHKKKLHTILVTSAGPAEGKSTTAANLAISIAKKGTKTLLVDSDLRKPVLDVLFMGSHRKVGLTNHLGREIGWQEAIRETSVSGLYIMAAGTGVTNAPEIISSKSMVSFIKEARREYGITVFDSSPLLPVVDATILASVVDGVILVARASKTSRDGLRRSMEVLRSAKANILGVVLTGVDIFDISRYRGYYHAYLEGKDK